MNDKLIFTIPDMDLLPDCFRSIMPSREFTPDENGIVNGWPSFHVSKADPDGGYKDYTYTVRFRLDVPVCLKLHIGFIVSTPRLPYARIDVNGSSGYVYPFPGPSHDKEIRPGHALHAAIYNREDTYITIPENVLHAGENTLSITAVDDIPSLTVYNREAVARLDRMADACGWHYGALELTEADPLQSKATVRPTVLFRETDGKLCERIDVTLEPSANCTDVSGHINIGGVCTDYSFPANAFGQYTLQMWVPDSDGELNYEIRGSVMQSGSVRRSRKWKVYITPHAHTDVGYTHRQPEVAERMSRNLDTAIDTLERTPDFSYILDSSWAIEDYIATRSHERMQKLLELAKQKRIGIPSNYVDLLTQTASLEDLIHNSDFTDSLLAPEGISADRVDMVDVASATSSYPTILAGLGVKWMLHANNQDRGPFRFNGNLHRKSPFRWEGPDGSSILVWLSRMYCELKKVCGSPGSVPAAERGLGMWLMDYERDDYLPDAVLLYGMEADNTDIDVRMADFISLWKQEYAYPQLIPSDGSTFFEYVTKWADRFPTYKGDEGAWWEDGCASSFNETVKLRRAQDGLKCAEPLESFAALLSGGRFPLEQYDTAWHQAVLYDEHTWGSFMAQADAGSSLQEDSWMYKREMAEEAYVKTEALLTRAESRICLMWNNAGREVVVFNPYNFPVSGMAEVEIAGGETVCDAAGNEVPWRILSVSSTQKRVLIPVNNMSGFSYKRFTLRPAKPEDRNGRSSNLPIKPVTVLENRFYRVTVDTERAVVTSIFDKELSKELINGSAAELLYATGGEGSMLRGNHAGLRRDGALLVHAFIPDECTLEETATDVSLTLSGQAVRGHVELVLTLPHDTREVLFSYAYDKNATTAPEAVYVRFPFNVTAGAPVRSDSHIGWVDWMRNTLPGACREWLPLQTSIMVHDNGCDIQLASPDAFLFTVNSPVSGKWSSDLDVSGGDIYSYVLNNYWHTNYLGKQGGRFVFRYALRSDKSISDESAFRYGWRCRRGLLARRMSYQEFRTDIPAQLTDPAGGILFKAISDHISVNTIRKSRTDDSMYLIRLLEIGGREGSIRLEMPGFRIVVLKAVNHLEHNAEMLDPIQPITLKPWEIRSVLVKFEPDSE